MAAASRRASTTVPPRGSSIGAAVVAAVDDRLDARAGRVRARVDVGDQPDRPGRRRAASRSRSRSRRARRRRGRPRCSSSTSIRASSSWPGVLGLCVRSRARLRVDADVAQEALQHVRRERLGQGGGEAHPLDRIDGARSRVCYGEHAHRTRSPRSRSSPSTARRRSARTAPACCSPSATRPRGRFKLWYTETGPPARAARRARPRRAVRRRPRPGRARPLPRRLLALPDRAALGPGRRGRAAELHARPRLRPLRARPDDRRRAPAARVLDDRRRGAARGLEGRAGVRAPLLARARSSCITARAARARGGCRAARRANGRPNGARPLRPPARVRMDVSRAATTGRPPTCGWTTSSPARARLIDTLHAAAG